MKTGQLYRTVFIDGKEENLPKKNGVYFVKLKTPKDQLELSAVSYIWENDRKHVNGFWLTKVDWYLQPVPTPSEAVTDEEIEKHDHPCDHPESERQYLANGDERCENCGCENQSELAMHPKQTAPLQAIIDSYHQSDVTQAKYDIKAETLEKIIEKQAEIIEAKNKLIEFAEAPQYHEIMTAKAIQKVVIISLESELAALQAGEATKEKPFELTVIDEIILQQAIDTWGVDAQCEMLLEECLELALALQKDKRTRGNKEEKFDSIIDEIADVTIMIKQAHRIYPIDLINERIAFKMNRLKERLIEKII